MTQSSSNSASAGKDQASEVFDLARLFNEIEDPEQLSIELAVNLLAEFPRTGEAIINHVNSPDIGMRHEVNDLEHAVAILGPKRLVKFLDKWLRTDAGHPGIPMPSLNRLGTYNQTVE